MLTKRIIPCLDVKDGRTVKGTNFVNLIDAGNPIELAIKYSENLADELVFLDISASEENRSSRLDWVENVAKNINIPFTVGGGVSSLKDVELLLKNGADKIAINSAAVKNPKLISDIANQFGSQCVVVAIDAKPIQDIWKVHLIGGKKPTDINLIHWAKEAENLGAGEILFTSMKNDGTKDGFENDTIAQLTSLLNIPIIASGGAGKMTDFEDVFLKANADAALAASVFHFDQIQIPELKSYLKSKNISIRI